MNRPIKFRVWNDKQKKWEHGPGQECNLFGEMILLGGFMRVSLEELNDCIPLEFTGLKDKDGTEIYEGDILDLTNQPGKICYYLVTYGPRQYYSGFTLTPLNKERKTLSMEFDFRYDTSFKVVGNEYDNPDMIIRPKVIYREPHKPVYETEFFDRFGKKLQNGDFVKLSQRWKDKTKSCHSDYGHIWISEESQWFCSYNHTYSESADPLEEIPQQDIIYAGNLEKNPDLMDA